MAFLAPHMRTAVYVDGFNLYYRALKGTQYRWLDLLELSRRMVSAQNHIHLIRYFTARVRANSYKPDQHVKQDQYLRAVQAHCGNCLSIHESQFYQHNVRMPLAHPVPGGPRTVEVIKSEEKGSDVKLAVHLLNDAWRGAFDVALVISNDSDLAEAIRLARATGRNVGVVNPSATDKTSYELLNACTFRRRIEVKHLKAAQMPPEVLDGATKILKPTDW